LNWRDGELRRWSDARDKVSGIPAGSEGRLEADSEQIQNFRCKWRQSTLLEEAWDIGEAWECFCREKAELWAELWLDQALAEKNVPTKPKPRPEAFGCVGESH